MNAALPAARPRMSQAELLARIRRDHPGFTFDGVTVVGVRGYYEDTLGKPGANDRGMYDDALFVVSPNVFASFNGNVDPSRVRKGSGTGAGKGMASLKPGLYRAHHFGIHRAGRPTAHEALIQTAGEVTVIRDGSPNYEDTGHFGINIHRGGNTTTSSEGCQTLPPGQWPAFIALCQAEARRLAGGNWRRLVVTYVLLDGAS